MQTVSVIIPVFNLEGVLADTLKSVLKQTYKELQIILINDGSSDKSAEICSEYAARDGRILVINKENGGVSSARNAGLRAATGEFVMFVDGDDLLEADAVEVMLANINEFGSDMCICSSYFSNNKTNYCAVNTKFGDVFFRERLVKMQLCFGVTSSLWLCMIKRRSLANIAFDETVHALEDWKFIFDVFANGVEKVSICRKPLYHYMIREGSASHSSVNDRKMSCFNMTKDVLSTVNEKYPQHSDIAECHDSRLLCHLMVIAANCDFVDEKYNREFKRIARRELLKTIKSKCISKRNKLYVLMTAISPKLYYFSYKAKYKIKGKV